MIIVLLAGIRHRYIDSTLNFLKSALLSITILFKHLTFLFYSSPSLILVPQLLFISQLDPQTLFYQFDSQSINNPPYYI
jgi:hypothetical protein